jgi:hypothetical protein
MKKYLGILLIFLSACSTNSQYIRVFSIDETSRMFFIPSTVWLNKEIEFDVDFTYRDNAELPTLCNISIIQKNAMPRGVSKIDFRGDGKTYSVYDIKGLSAESKKNLLRITSSMSHDDFLALMKSEDIKINIILDHKEYECIPSDVFSKFRQEFLTLYFINGY